MDVLVELLEALNLVRAGASLALLFWVQLAFLSLAKFACFLKRSEEVTFVHTETPRISNNRSRTFHQLEPCLEQRCTDRSHSLIWKFLKTGTGDNQNFSWARCGQ